MVAPARHARLFPEGPLKALEGVAVRSYKKFLILASFSIVSTPVVAAVPSPANVYPAMEPDEPARLVEKASAPELVPAEAIAPPTDLSRVDRKPAVEPRVYVESADSKTGYVYYDMPGQVQHAEPKAP